MPGGQYTMLVSQRKAKQRRRERREIQSALAEQLRLLGKRCRDFDEGDWGEAVEIAVRLRVILNPGGKSKPSVVQSLGAEKVPLLSTCEPIPEHALWANGGLYTHGFKKDEQGLHYNLFPRLGNGHYRAEIPAHKWWNQVVDIPSDGHKRVPLTRKDVIATTANEGGGAHVAALASDRYDVISQPGGIVTITVGSEDEVEEVPIGGVHLAMLRQMAYEVLNSPKLLDLANTDLGS
jgi:hypothetical protein